MSVEQISMNQLITDNIDVWTSTVKTKSASGRGSSKKRELYGVKKLRELILELAVRGKLVPQDPTDEPASILLERIAAEKAQLVKEKKIKKPKNLPEISDDEKVVKLPQGWVQARFGECFLISSGNSFKKEEELTEGEFIYCKVGDMNLADNESSITTSSTFIVPTDKQLKSLILSGSIIFPKRGGAIATNKKRFVRTPIFSDSNVMAVKPFYGVSLEFSMLWLNSIDLAALNTGTSVPQINNKDIEPLVFHFPPEKEQHRIVAKVDELMTLCDQLEQQTEASIEAHQVLVITLLDTLTNSADADELMQNWARISEHFDTLFTTEASIDQLKQTILQLAVMGKLVPQDPNDEPAAKLLERLDVERNEWLIEHSDTYNECKTMLRKLKKLDQPKPPFPLPRGWKCVHLIELSRLLVDCHNKTAPYVESGIPIIRTTNIRERKFVDKDLKYVNQETYDYWSRRCPPKHGDIMFTREAPMGEALIVPEGSKWCLGQRTMLIRPMHDYISNEFLLLALTEPHLLERASEHAVGLTVKHLRVGDVENLNLPIPPLSEQLKIVAKVNELMDFCVELKVRLKESQSTQLNLTDAIVEQAV